MLSKNQSKYIKSLHLKKKRLENGVFFAEGTKVVLDLLAAGIFDCQEIIGTAEWFTDNSIFLHKHTTATCTVCNPEDLTNISALATPSNVFALFEMLPQMPPKSETTLTLALDGLQDPGNLGTIIRCADWFGVQQIICSEDCADMYNPKVVQSTMGSIGRVQLYYTNLPNWLLQNANRPILATGMAGIALPKINIAPNSIIIIGNEGKGITPAVMALANQIVTIPKFGAAESLNAAVATGILLAAATI
jgi:RNA methyltransferase, TrmH family